MGALISRIAKYLIKQWDGLGKWTKWTIEQLVGSAIVDAIKKGYDATVEFLKRFSSSTLEKLASLLGI